MTTILIPPPTTTPSFDEETNNHSFHRQKLQQQQKRPQHRSRICSSCQPSIYLLSVVAVLLILQCTTKNGGFVQGQCMIDSFMLHYANASGITYQPYLNGDLLDEDPFRGFVPTKISSGYQICYEPNPFSIEAVVQQQQKQLTRSSSKQTTTTTTTSIGASCSLLFQLDSDLRSYTPRHQKSSPYFMLGTEKANVTTGTKFGIRGKAFRIGNYQLTVTSTSSSTNEVLATKVLNFEVVDCGTSYTQIPPNECDTCHPTKQTCVNSQCIDIGSLRFDLTQTGYSFTDLEYILIPPSSSSSNNIEYNYDDFDPSAGSLIGLSTDGNGYDYCCTCRKSWMKSFVVSTKNAATAPPKGLYRIKLQYLDWCFSCGEPIETGPQYQLKVYIGTTLVQTYTDPIKSSKEITFTL